MLGIKECIKNSDDIRFLVPLKINISLDELNMLASGTEKSLARCVYTEMDRRHQLTFNISSYISFEEHVGHIDKYLDAVEMILGFLNTYLFCEEENINTNNIIMKPEYVFLNGNNTTFICLPFADTGNKSFHAVFLKFLKIFKRSKFYKEIRGLKHLQTAEEAINFLNEYLSGLSVSPVPITETETTYLQTAEEMSNSYSETETTFLGEDLGNGSIIANGLDKPSEEQIHDGTSSESSESETTFLTPQCTSFNETTVLNRSSSLNVNPFIIRNKTGETVSIEKAVFTIGKSNRAIPLDYVISDNRNISRNHVSIIVEDDTCYLVDNNSTNKTYVEGATAKPYEKVELYNGSLFSLADEHFQFFIKER